MSGFVGVLVELLWQYIYIYTYMCMYLYIYIYVYRDISGYVRIRDTMG